MEAISWEMISGWLTLIFSGLSLLLLVVVLMKITAECRSVVGEVLSKVKKQLDTASNTIEMTGVRTRAMERKLRDVEELPTAESAKLLGLDASGCNLEDSRDSF